MELAVRLRTLIASVEERCGLGRLDPRSRDIVYFVAERETVQQETTVSHIILNDRFGSLGTAQRHLYALIADRWLEARTVEEDARRKNIRLGLLSREAFQTMSEMLKLRLAAEMGFATADGTSVSR